MRGGFGGMGGMGGGGGGGGMWHALSGDSHLPRPDEEGPKPEVSRRMLKRIIPYLRPYWARWLAILSCIWVERGLDVLPPLCAGAVINILSKSGHSPGDYRMVVLLAAAMVSLAVTSGLLGVVEQTLTAHVGQSIMYDMRNDLYRHLQKMSLAFYTRTRSGEIVSRISNDVNAVQGVTTGTLPTIASNIAALTTVSITLFGMDWKLALLAVSVVPFFYLPSRIVGRIRRRLSVETQESQAGLLAFMNERLHVGGAILTSIFGQRQADADEFAAQSSHLRQLSIRQTVVGRWLRMILMVFAVLGPALIYWYGGRQILYGSPQVKVGTLVAFAYLLGQLYRPLMQLATVYVDIQGSFGVFERIFAYLDMVPEVQDGPEPRPLPQARGHLEFQDVTFSYPRPAAALAPNGAEEGEGPKAEAPKADPFALRDVNFEIAPGQQVALVGPSGAGKTTITYLVPRFYDPNAGRILLDGQDLRDIGQEELRRHIGMVTQETFLFHDTLRRNLLYARPDATEADLVDACTAANISDFIASLPEGYDTVVGERGFRLSGGEKQRVSIARALLKDPAILILDEATSSLDATSEYLIQTALEKLLHGRTSLIIAHRLSTILSSDKIIVMDEGRVVEAGSHEELLEHHGLYASLFEQQFGKVLEMDTARREADV